jgi:hypothetical protein
MKSSHKLPISSTVINNIDICIYFCCFPNLNVAMSWHVISFCCFSSAQKLAQAIETFSIKTWSNLGAHKLKMIMCCTIFLSVKDLKRLS